MKQKGSRRAAFYNQSRSMKNQNGEEGEKNPLFAVLFSDDLVNP
jgi:hypothetical protein